MGNYRDKRMKRHIRHKGRNFPLCGMYSLEGVHFADSPEESDCKACVKKFNAPPRPVRSRQMVPRLPVAKCGFEIGNSKENE